MWIPFWADQSPLKGEWFGAILMDAISPNPDPLAMPGIKICLYDETTNIMEFQLDLALNRVLL
jgi:hypothetical protein